MSERERESAGNAKCRRYSLVAILYTQYNDDEKKESEVENRKSGAAEKEKK